MCDCEDLEQLFSDCDRLALVTNLLFPLQEVTR
jgi:hypothetical protein